MTTRLSAALESFTRPNDLDQLRLLEEAAKTIDPANMTKEDFRAIFNLFERFPEDDAYGGFWSFLHAAEAAGGYEADLIESVTRKPAEFNVTMVGRIVNSGVLQFEGTDLVHLLSTVAAGADTSRARETARNYLSGASRMRDRGDR
jgi:hypothetical protein